MKINLVAFIILLLSITNIQGQGESWNWYFGYNAGITFPGGVAPLAVINGQVNTNEGVATISDALGNLLFYTDGTTVYNKLHLVMTNGTGLFGNSSSTQSAIILKKPGSATIYYIFTQDATAGVNGLCYSEVDMSLSSGNGAVTVKNAFLWAPSTEKLTSVRHCNGVDIWVITHDWNTNQFRSYLVTSTGVNVVPVLSSAGTVNTGGSNYIGYMKVSPDGRKLAYANFTGGIVEILDFDSGTGIASNPITISGLMSIGYGIEFSPDNSKLYASDIGANKLYQWNLCAGSSAAIISSSIQIGGVFADTPCALQLGPDQKIYVGLFNTSWLGVINNPNVSGIGCNYVNNVISLGGKIVALGLPTFMSSFFSVPPPPFTNTIVCLNVNFTSPTLNVTSCSSSSNAITSYSWDFGDAASGSNNFSTLANPSHAYTSSGTYSVQLIIGKACGADTLKQQVTVLSCSPILSINNATVCLGDCAILTATTTNGSPPYSYTWTPNIGSTAGPYTVCPASTTVYTVTSSDATSATVVSTCTITVNALPTPIIGSNSPVCLGNSINLTSSGGNTYTWSGPNSFTSSVQNPTITGATTVMNGVYSVTVTNTNNCVNTATINVTITAPTTSASNTGPYCAGSNIQLNTPLATSYVWVGPNTFTSNTQNPSISASTSLMNGTYTVVATIGTCTASATTSVTVNALPTPSPSNTGPYCTGTNIQLNSSAAVSYTWSGPNSFASNLQNPLVGPASTANAGIYTLSISDANGCINSSITNVVVNPLPIPVIGSNNPVCIGNNINLTSGGGNSYIWSGPNSFSSSVQNPTITSSTIAMSGVYTVTVTNANSCQNTATINVIVTTPTTSASNTGPYCAGSNIQLNTPLATSYVWTGPNAFTSNTQNPSISASTVLMNGTYTIIATIGTCTASATTTVTVNALPTPSPSNTGPYCAGTNIQLNSSAAVSYTWTGPNNYLSNLQNPSILSASLTNAGIYTLMVSNANGCVNSSTTNIVVNPLPIPVIGSNNPVCIGNSVNLTSANASTYFWNGPLGFVSSLQNPIISGATAANSGIYSLTISALSCTNTATISISVVSPTTNASNTGPYCAGATIQLTAPVANSYTWTGPNAFNANTQNPSISNSIIGMSGTYTLIASLGTCTASATTSITVNALPIVTATNNAPICTGQTLNLVCSAALTYTWSGPNAFNSNSQNPNLNNATALNSGNYTVAVSDANNCTNSIVTNVVVNSNPSILAGGATVCIGTSATLTASGGANSYSWSGPNSFTSNQQNPTLPLVNNITIGNYSVIATSASGCSSSVAVTVGTFSLPIPTATATTKACLNTQINLQGSAGFLAYQWMGPDGFVSLNTQVSFTPTNMSQTGVYTLSVIDNNGCSGSVNVFIALDPPPNASIISDNNNKCVPFCSNFFLQNAAGSSSLVSYSWLINGQTTNGSNLNYCITSAGDYDVKSIFTDVNGCTNSTNITVTAYPVPYAQFEFSPSNPLEAENEVHFIDGSSGANIHKWNWYFINNSGYYSAQQNPNYIFDKSGVYPVALIVTNDFGCTDTLVKTITISEGNNFYVPNTFTPNEDGINDVFYPKGYNITKYDLTIFDRWGEKLFSTNNFSIGWDGKFNGVHCKSDVYIWKINITTANSKLTTHTGHVTLNR